MKRLIIKRGWAATAAARTPAGSSAARKVRAALVALLEGPSEPDRIELLPPHQECSVRYVAGTSLEIWYIDGADFVSLYALKSRV